MSNIDELIKLQTIVMPNDYEGGQLIIFNDNLYFFGGDTNGSTKLRKYDVSNLSWVNCSDSPLYFSRNRVSNCPEVVVYNNKLYGMYSSKLYYTEDCENWSNITLASGSVKGDLVVYNNNLYLVGRTQAKISNVWHYYLCVYLYDETNESVEEISKIEYSDIDIYTPIIVYDGEIHIPVVNVTINNTQYYYHFIWNGTSWRTVSSPLSYNDGVIYYPSVFVYDDILYFSRGRSTYSDLIYRYVNGTWERDPNDTEKKVIANATNKGVNNAVLGWGGTMTSSGITTVYCATYSSDGVTYDHPIVEGAPPTPPEPAISKVIYGDQTLIDLTSDTVTAATLLEGYTAHGADGQIIVGTLKLS